MSMSAIDVKNSLYDMVNGARSPQEICEAITKVLDVIEITQGFWVELNYCYKVVDLVGLCLDRLAIHNDACMHHTMHSRRDAIRSRLSSVESTFYRLQHRQRAMAS